MHILVVDDFVLVELALAQVIQDTSHTLTGVRDPRSLPEVLGQGPQFDLALVDINFGPGVPTGLTAMRILRDLSPETKIVIESTDEERNRLLFLLASFSFFEPLALMSKAAPAQAMRALIDAVDRGELTAPGFAGPDGVQGHGIQGSSVEGQSRGWTSESPKRKQKSSLRCNPDTVSVLINERARDRSRGVIFARSNIITL